VTLIIFLEKYEKNVREDPYNFPKIFGRCRNFGAPTVLGIAFWLRVRLALEFGIDPSGLGIDYWD
jgi:hypothetical protein